MQVEQMKTYRFAYGSGTVEFPLEEKNIIGELHGNVVEPISDIRRELWASLDAPIDSAPLCRRVTPGSTVALVVSDMSRFWMRQDLVVPLLVEPISDTIRQLHADGTTILLVEQNAQAALSVADRGYVLETGKIVTTGTGTELLASPAIKKAYLGG